MQTKLNSKGRRNKRKNCCRQGRAKAWGVEGADEFKFRRGEKERKNGCRKGRAKAWGMEGADEFKFRRGEKEWLQGGPSEGLGHGGRRRI